MILFIFKTCIKGLCHAITTRHSEANPSTTHQHRQFVRQMERINEEESIESIWEAIRNNVATRMFSEFGSLYSAPNDPMFTRMIDSSCDDPLKKSPAIQIKLEQSAGYLEYRQQRQQQQLPFRWFDQNLCQHDTSPNSSYNQNTPRP